MNSLSTFQEVLKRGPMKIIEPSVIRSNVFILTFADGSQANVDIDTYAQITEHIKNTTKI